MKLLLGSAGMALACHRFGSSLLCLFCLGGVDWALLHHRVPENLDYNLLRPVPPIEGGSVRRTALNNARMQSKGQEREEARLIEVLRDKDIVQSDPQRVAQAIRRLGELKSVMAVTEVARFLAFPDPMRSLFRGPFDEWHRYPAMYALAQVGKPSLPALVRVIRSQDPESLDSQNAARTVVAIFDGKALDAAKYLEEQASRQRNRTARARLLRAAERTKGTKAPNP